MTQDDILDMARSAGVTDGIELQHEIDAVMRFAELVATAQSKALANEFSETVTKTLESLAATTLMPSPPMPTTIKNLDAIAAAVAAEREACANVCEEFEHQNWDYMEGARLAAAAIRARGDA